VFALQRHARKIDSFPGSVCTGSDSSEAIENVHKRSNERSVAGTAEHGVQSFDFRHAYFRGSTNQHAITNRRTSAKEKEILLMWCTTIWRTTTSTKF
jgi:hypothetical protein